MPDTRPPAPGPTPARPGPGRPPIAFTVDGQTLTTDDPTMTPRAIMVLAGIDPGASYLVQLRGREEVSYKDEPDAEIRIRPNAVFISLSTGPTPVS